MSQSTIYRKSECQPLHVVSAPRRGDRATLANRDGDTGEISLPLLRIGPGDAAQDITAVELEAPADSQPVPAWVWVLCIVTALIAGVVFASR